MNTSKLLIVAVIASLSSMVNAKMLNGVLKYDNYESTPAFMRDQIDKNPAKAVERHGFIMENAWTGKIENIDGKIGSMLLVSKATIKSNGATYFDDSDIYCISPLSDLSQFEYGKKISFVTADYVETKQEKVYDPATKMSYNKVYHLAKCTFEEAGGPESKPAEFR